MISGVKASELAKQIEQRFAQKNLVVKSSVEFVPRPEYLKELSTAKIAVCLPHSSEGFYLPALEAMACGAILVCPDCVGNRDFCHDGVNCFRPEYDGREIAAAAEKALEMSPKEAAKMRKQADHTVAEHSLNRERASFLQILDQIDKIWEG